MKLRDYYDWVVLGDHPGALLSASLAARLGLSVLVLPLAPSQKLTISKSGQCLDPESNYLIGLGGVEQEQFSGLLGDCLRRLGILPSEADLIRSEEVAPQIITPQTRLVLDTDDDRLESELVREFGREAIEKLGLMSALKQSQAEYLVFWLKLPDRLSLISEKDRRKVSPSSLNFLHRELARNPSLQRPASKIWFSRDKRVSDLAFNLGRRDFNETCHGLWYGLTSSVTEDPALSDLIHLLALARTGASFKGGMSAFRDFLLRLAQRLGAHVPQKSDCRRIFVENGKFVGVQIAHRGNMIGASGGVLGCSLLQAEEKISLSGRTWSNKLSPPPYPIGWKFTLALTVHSEAIPPGMTPRVVWQEKDAPGLEIEIVDPADYGVRQPEHRILFARTLMPFKPESLDTSYQRLIAARMMRQLTELIPFLEFHVTRIYPDFRVRGSTLDTVVSTAPTAGASAALPEELAEVYGFSGLDAIPENIRCFAGAGVGCRSGIDGLFVASGESFPALGSLGGTVAAVESVAWLAHRSGLAGPFI